MIDCLMNNFIQSKPYDYVKFKEYLQVGKGFWAWIIIMTIAGYSPVPFKLLTITSGFIHFPFHIFIIITILINASNNP